MSEHEAAARPRVAHSALFELVVGVGLSVVGLVPLTPYDTPFVERDPVLSRPLVDSTVPTWMIALLAVIFPALALLLLLGISASRKQVRFRSAVTTGVWVYLAAMCTLGLTMAATNVLKNLVGRKRPNFFGLCNYAGSFNQADQAAYLAATEPGRIGSLSRCTGSAHDLADGQRSFPSGHSSTAFAGTSFLVFALRGALGVGEGTYFSPRALLAGTPLLLASWIGATRLRDGWHNYDDVAVGAAIGILAAAAGWAHLCAHASQRDAYNLLLGPAVQPGGAELPAVGLTAPERAAQAGERADNHLIDEREAARSDSAV